MTPQDDRYIDAPTIEEDEDATFTPEQIAFNAGYEAGREAYWRSLAQDGDDDEVDAQG